MEFELFPSYVATEAHLTTHRRVFLGPAFTLRLLAFCIPAISIVSAFTKHRYETGCTQVSYEAMHASDIWL